MEFKHRRCEVRLLPRADGILAAIPSVPRSVMEPPVAVKACETIAVASVYGVMAGLARRLSNTGGSGSF